MHIQKIATAVPITPALYQVTYSDTRAFDPCVPYAYLRLVAAAGYRVVIRGAEQ